MYDKDGDRLAELRTGLHNPETERNDFSRQKEVDDLRRVVLDKSANDSEAGKSKVFERTALGGRVEKGVEVERNMS